MGIPCSRFLEAESILRHPDAPSAPSVSVIMPTYLLRPGAMNQRAIESVLGQSVTDVEFLLIDDGSIDDLHKVLLSYYEHDSRITIVRYGTNSGLHALRLNAGLMLARGKYVAYQFEDDEWEPHCLERLLATADAGPTPCAAYGTVRWTIHRAVGHTEERLLGDREFNYALLQNQNYLPHCAVLHPRAVVADCGLYDPHILMRRLCDHDLWLRMARVLAFRRCRDIVGSVTAGTKHSLGRTIDHDLLLARRHFARERNEHLTPPNVLSYEVDALTFEHDASEAHRIRERYIIPFWIQHPDVLTWAERKTVLATRPRPARLCVTKADYSTSIDVTIRNFARALPDHVQSFGFLDERSLAAARWWNHDVLVLYRTIAQSSLDQLAVARRQGKTVVYIMDDNMFRFGTGYLESEFPYLKPGTPGYRTLEEEVSAADVVVSYTPTISRDCRRLNPRVIELRTNILERWLPDVSAPSGADRWRRRRYAILTGSVRKGELQALWPAFREFAQGHREDVEFHFWGLAPAECGEPLACATFHRPFDHAYDSYLAALTSAGFDFVLCPLFDDHDAKRSKSPIKYLEACAAGAVGIFSEATAYRTVTDGVSGFTVPNEPEAWRQALERSLAMTEADRLAMLGAALAHVRREFTTESQALEYAAVFEAADLHAALGSHAAAGGRARIAFFFHEGLAGGATLHLARDAVLLERYGFDPVFCFRDGQAVAPAVARLVEEAGGEVARLDFVPSGSSRPVTEDDHRRAAVLAAWLQQQDIRCVHGVTFLIDVALAARQAGLPYIATLHQDQEPADPGGPTASAVDFAAAVHSSSGRFARIWEERLEVPAACIRAPLQRGWFETFATRAGCPAPAGAPPRLLVAGTLQPRKGQLEAIRAVRILADRGVPVHLTLLGYTDLRKDYTVECRRLIEALDLRERVTIVDFVEDVAPFFDAADYLVCSSDVESMPQSILQAMASGVRVVTTPVGGVGELIVDGFGGVIADGTGAGAIADAIARALAIPDAQWRRMVATAHHTVRMVCAEDVVSYQLLRLYVAATERHRARAPLPRGTAPDPSPAGVESPGAASRGPLPGSPVAPDVAAAAPTASDAGLGDIALRPFTRQTFALTPDADGWAGFDLLVGGVPGGSGVQLTYSIGAGTNGALRRGTVATSVRESGGWIAVRFPEIVHSAGRAFSLSVGVQAERRGGRVGVYTYVRAARRRRPNVWPSRRPRPFDEVVHRLHYVKQPGLSAREPAPRSRGLPPAGSRGGNRRRPRVLAILPQLIPSTVIGVIKPLTALHRARQIVADFAFEYWLPPRSLQRADVVVFCRNTEPAHGRVLEAALELGKPIIYELDDNFFDIPLSSQGGRYHREETRLAQLQRYLTSATVVRVYSTLLQERLRPMNPRVRCVDGSVDAALLPTGSGADDGDRPVRIVYATSRIEDELAPLFLKDLRAILDACRGRVEAHFWGYHPPEMAGHPAVRFEGFVRDYDRFFHRFARAGFDVGLAPLVDDPFYRSKSDNKFREYAACRIAGIYSNVGPYAERVSDGETGLLVDNQPGSWFHAMRRLVEDRDLRRGIADRAFAVAMARYHLDAARQTWMTNIQEALSAAGDRRPRQPAIPPVPQPAVRDNRSPGLVHQAAAVGRRLLAAVSRSPMPATRGMVARMRWHVRSMRMLAQLKRGLWDPPFVIRRRRRGTVDEC